MENTELQTPLMSPGSVLGVALGDTKNRLALAGLLRSFDVPFLEWNGLGDLVLGLDRQENPLGALFFSWEEAQEGNVATQLQIIHMHEKGASAPFFALSGAWNDIRTRMRARVAGCDDILAFPPESSQIRRALGLPGSDAPLGEPPGVPTSEVPEAPTSPEDGLPPDLRVMVVDDAAVVRVGLSRLLAKMGCAVTEAENGQDALRKLPSAAPRVIITDLLMPYMDGFGFMQKVREKEPWKQVPIIVVSGYGDKSRLIQALRHGAVDFIVKPFRPEVIRQKIASALQITGTK